MTDETEAARRRPPPPPPRPTVQHGTPLSQQHGAQASPQHTTHMSPQHTTHMSPQHSTHMSAQHSAQGPQHSAQLAIQPVRPPEPRPRTQQPPRLIRPSEHLAIVERARERRAPPLTPTVAVIHGPRPPSAPPGHHLVPSRSTAIVPHVPLLPHAHISHIPHHPPVPQVPPAPPALRPRAPPAIRMPAPIPPPVMRLPQPRRDVQHRNVHPGAFQCQRANAAYAARAPIGRRRVARVSVAFGRYVTVF
ncbi:unnamed protein product, partial [Iphiclides podalirius]